MDVSASTILVVDDDTQVRNLIHVFLYQAGFAVLVACDGVQALNCFETHRADVALLVTDIDMPSMDGMELAQRIRAEDPSLPIVLVSGNFTKFGGSPPRDFFLLEKPFGLRSLVGTVENALASRLAPQRFAAEAGRGTAR